MHWKWPLYLFKYISAEFLLLNASQLPHKRGWKSADFMRYYSSSRDKVDLVLYNWPTRGSPVWTRFWPAVSVVAFFFFRSTCDGHGREEPISIKNLGRCYGERFCVPMCRTVRTTGDQGWYLLRNLREISWKSRPCFLSGWMCQSSLLLSRWKYNQTKWSSFLFLKSKRGNWAQLRCSISETLMTLKLWFWKGKGRDRDRLGGREPRASQSHHLHYALLPSLPIIFFAAKMIGHFTITTKRGEREQSTQKNRTEQDRAYARHTTEVGVEQRPKGTVWEREAQSLDAQKRKKNSIKFGFLVFPSKTVEEIPKSSHPISIFSLPNNFWARRWLLSESTTWGLLHCLGFPMFFLLLFQ